MRLGAVAALGSAALVVEFFIEAPFAGGRRAGADDADEVIHFIMDDKEQFATARDSDGEKTWVVIGVVGIEVAVGEGVFQEDTSGLFKGDAMLLEVGGGFGWVELEAQRVEVHAQVVGAILARAGGVACARGNHIS